MELLLDLLESIQLENVICVEARGTQVTLNNHPILTVTP